MLKKLMFIIALFSILIFSFTCYTFAASNVGNDLKDTTSDIGNGVKDLGQDVRNGVGAVEDGIEDMFKKDDNNMNTTDNNNYNTENPVNTTTVTNNPTSNTNNNVGLVNNDNNYQNGYSATRTSANTGFMGMSSTAWSWFVVAIIAVAVIALLWYFTSKNTNGNNHE